MGTSIHYKHDLFKFTGRRWEKRITLYMVYSFYTGEKCYFTIVPNYSFSRHPKGAWSFTLWLFKRYYCLNRLPEQMWIGVSDAEKKSLPDPETYEGIMPTCIEQPAID